MLRARIDVIIEEEISKGGFERSYRRATERRAETDSFPMRLPDVGNSILLVEKANEDAPSSPVKIISV